MSLRNITPTGVERTFGEEEIIVSKTDLQGRITYANDVFLRVAGYTEAEILGKPHSLIRHPAMPRVVFKLLWDTIAQGTEVFAYVINLAKNGDHYWVFAHVTPTFDDSGRIIGYHSSRRAPVRSAVDAVRPVYAALLAEEAKHGEKLAQLGASSTLFASFLEAKATSYDELVWALAS